MLLLKYGATIEPIVEYLINPIESAILFGFTEIVKILLDNGAKLQINCLSKFVKSVLNNKNYDVFDLFIKRKITSPNTMIDNMPLLCFVIQNSSLDYRYIKVLTDNNVDVGLSDNNGRITAHYLSTLKYEVPEEIIKIILGKNNKYINTMVNFETPLVFAVHSNNKYIVNTLLNNNADVNFPETVETSRPLYIAVKQKNIGIIKLLLENDAKIENYLLFKKLLENDDSMNNYIISLLDKHKEKIGGFFKKYLVYKNKYLSLKKYIDLTNVSQY